MFHGPREAILPFFQDLGFKCPVGKGAADFLQEVTTFGEQRVRGVSTAVLGGDAQAELQCWLRSKRPLPAPTLTSSSLLPPGM